MMRYFFPLFILLFSLLDASNCDPNAVNPPQNVEEKMATYDCRQKVRELGNEMRATMEKLVRDTIEDPYKKIQVLRQLYPYIDALERNAIYCCENGQTPACCEKEMTDQLERWKVEGLSVEVNQE